MTTRESHSTSSAARNVAKYAFKVVTRLFLDEGGYNWLIPLLLLAEVALNAVIIQKVSYTEIDWKAYMQEVAGVVEAGQFDYSKLSGDTGPLVYPAGFVYIYAVLYWMTSKGENILLAQVIFAGIYVMTQYIVFHIYRRAKMPPFLLVLLCLSKRVHSIYSLRLFNDPIAMLFLYSSLWSFLKSQWITCAVFFSIALSIKMNILLFAPAMAFVFLRSIHFSSCLFLGVTTLLIQMGLAYPFLVVSSQHYFNRAFEFGRKFDFKWTVNWRFLPESVFMSDHFSRMLLAFHILVLFIFFALWSRRAGGLHQVFLRSLNGDLSNEGIRLSSDRVVLFFFVSNFVGIVFARSLHYQFYSWYFHTLPFLVWQTEYHLTIRLAILAALEACWNIYPSTPLTSSTLHFAHFFILYGLFKKELHRGEVKFTSLRRSIKLMKEN